MTELAHPRRPRRPATRLGLAAAGTLLGLVLCEVGLRAHYAAGEAERARRWRAVGEVHHGEGPAKLGHLIRPHPDRKISYELIPDLNVDFMGASVAINAHGFRGPAYPTRPAPGVVRIVGIGDSVLFGWGVDYEESFLPVLGTLLAEAHPEVTFELINTGVPGYNTVMEVETLRIKGLAYRPDIVLVDFVGNDLAPPRFIPRGFDAWTLSRSFLAETVRSAIAGTGPLRLGGFEPPPRLADDPREFWVTLEYDPDRVPEHLRDMVGLESYSRAMRELADLGREHGFHIVATTHQEAPDYLRDTCAELGIPLAETFPRSRRYMEEHGIADRLGSALTVGATDTHPSPLAHRFQAEEILQRLSDEGILEEVLGRRSAER